jgi:hypothetical protein
MINCKRFVRESIMASGFALEFGIRELGISGKFQSSLLDSGPKIDAGISRHYKAQKTVYYVANAQCYCHISHDTMDKILFINLLLRI